MNFSLRPSVQRVGVLLGIMACVLPAKAQFIGTVSTPGVNAFASNWNGPPNGVFSQDNSGGAQIITFTSTDTLLSFALSFNLPTSNSLNLEAGGGPYTLVLGGDVSMNDPTTSMVTIGSAVASNALNIDMGIVARTFTIAAGNLMVLPNTVIGSAGLTKAGSGTLKMTGTNTFTGGTTVTGGTLQLGDSSNGSDGSVVGDASNGIAITGAGGIVDFSPTTNTRYSGVISGAGGVTKSGPALLELGASNSYSGTTTVNSGTLSDVVAAAFSSASPINVIGGTLAVNFNETIAGLSGSGSVSIGNSQRLTVANTGANTYTFSGVISGAGAFVKSGVGTDTGTLILTGANTFSGGTTVDSGTLYVGNGLTGSVTGNIINNASLVFSRSDDVAFSGVISGTGTLYQFGAGHLTLTGANTFTGNSVLLQGYLVLGPNGTLPGGVTFTGTTTLGGGELQFSRSDNVTFAGTITGPGRVSQLGQLSTSNIMLTAANTYSGLTTVGAGILTAANATGSATGTGSISVSAGATLQIGNGTAAGSVAGDISNSGLVFFNRSDAATFSGVISGPSTGVVSVNGAGGTTFTGANTYTGTTIVGTNDTLVLAHAGGGTLASGSDVSLGGGAVLNVNEDQIIRGLISNFATSVVNIAAGKTFTSNLPLAQSSRFDGQIAGTGALQKDGSGTLILTADQSFTGTVSVLGGMLQIGNGGTSGGLLGNITVSSSATLGFNRSDSTPITYAGVVSGGGSFQKNGSSTLVLTGSNTFAGTVIVQGGTLSVGAANAVPNVSVNLNTGTTLDVANDVTISQLFGPGTATIAAGKTLGLTATGNPQVSTLITGAGNVSVANTFTFVADETYTGTTTVTGGVLNLGNFGTTGSVAGDVVIGTGGSGMRFQRSNATTFGHTVSGNGFLTKGGSGILTLTGANTYTGSTNILGGTLKVGAANALPISTTFRLSPGTTLDVSNSQTIAGFINSFGSSILLATGQVLSVNLGSATAGTNYDGIMSGGGGLRIGSNNGNGQWVTLTGDNTFTGGTTVDVGGSLDLGTGSATGMIVGNVVDNGALNFQRSTDAQFTGVISGSGSVSLGANTGAGSTGAVVLTAANTYTGGTQVYQGKLFASNVTGSATGTGSVTVQTGGFIGGAGKIAGPLNVSTGGTIAPISDSLAPATLSVGATTFGGGGKFGLGLINATGVAGTDFGLLSISGSLTITATATSPFDIEVHSLTGMSGQGPLPSFNTSQSYSWMFVTTTGGIAGFNTAFFTVDTSALSTVIPGAFSVAQNGNSLLLQYSPTAVPEPSTWALLAVGLGVVVMVSIRERKFHRRVSGDLV
jgi:autotransporter-associated beta strand protein